MMLYGLNGSRLHFALTATMNQHVRLPHHASKPALLAQDAHADVTPTGGEIADKRRVQHAVCDDDELLTVKLRSSGF